MDKWKTLVMLAGGVLFATLVINWIKNRPAIRQMHEKIPNNIKAVIIAMVPVVFTEKNRKARYSFNWKKLLLLNLGICVLTGMWIYVEGPEADIKEWIGIGVFLMVLCSVIALIIDSHRYILMWLRRDCLYKQLGYVHSIVGGHAILSYYDFNTEEFVTKQVRFSNDEIRKSKICTKNNSFVQVILYVKDDKIKYVGLDW